MRHMRAGLFEQFADMQEWPAILVLRRCIHHDENAVVEGGAEITAKAGICRSRRDGKLFAGKQAVQPFGELVLALHIGVSGQP